MKENIRFTPSELTARDQLRYAGSITNMSDGPSIEGGGAAVATRAPARPSMVNSETVRVLAGMIPPEQRAQLQQARERALQQVNNEGVPANRHQRREEVIEMRLNDREGIFKRINRENISVEQAEQNADKILTIRRKLYTTEVSDPERLVLAKELLDLYGHGTPEFREALNDPKSPQSQAVLQIHELLGREVGDLSLADVRKKTEAFKERGIDDRDIIRDFMENGVTGAALTEHSEESEEERERRIKAELESGAEKRVEGLMRGGDGSFEEANMSRLAEKPIKDRLVKLNADRTLRQIDRDGYNIKEILFPAKFTFSIAEEDMMRLITDPLTWQASQFDQVYQAVVKGNELSSQTVQTIESNIGQGETYILYLREIAQRDPFIGSILRPAYLDKILDDWESIHATRINLMVGRSTYQQQDPDQVKQRAAQLRAAGLFRAFALDGGRVKEMHDRFNAKLKVKRDAEGGQYHYFSSTMMASLHDELIAEQLALARQGKGIFGDRYQEVAEAIHNENEFKRDFHNLNVKIFEEDTPEFKRELENRLGKEIVRAERTAYDAGELSLQIAHQVAKGYQPLGSAAFNSSPSFLGDRMMNSQKAFMEKWNTLQVEGQNQLEESFKDIARWWLYTHHGDPRSSLSKLGLAPNQNKNPEGYSDQDLQDIGRTVFFHRIRAADFYGSGWRAEKIFGQMENIIAYRAENDALYTYLSTSENQQEAAKYVLAEGLRESIKKGFQAAMIKEAEKYGWFPRGEGTNGVNPRTGQPINIHNNAGNGLTYSREFSQRMDDEVNRLMTSARPEDRARFEEAMRNGLTKVTKGVRDALLGKLVNASDPTVGEFLGTHYMERLRVEDKALFEEMREQGIGRAKEFGQFLRLQQTSDEYSSRRAQFEKIIDVRPEDIVRLFREHEILPGAWLDKTDTDNNNIALNSALANSAAMHAYLQANPTIEIKGYDDFMAHFGAEIGHIREVFMRKPIPELVKFASLNPAQEQEILTILRGTNGTDAEAHLKLNAIKESTELMQRFLLGGSTAAEYQHGNAAHDLEHLSHEMHDAHSAVKLADMLAKKMPKQDIDNEIAKLEREAHGGEVGQYTAEVIALYRRHHEEVPTTENEQYEYLDIYHRLEDDDGVLAQLKERDWGREQGVHDNVHELLDNVRFMDIYTRPEAVDDLFSGELQDVPANSGLRQLHEQWTNEMGQDALARTWGDGGDVYKAMNQHLVAFLSAESVDDATKAAAQMVASIASANGQDAKAEAARFTIGTKVINSELPRFQQGIGVKRRPFRQSSTRSQEIWGYTADVKEYGDIEKWFDHNKGLLIGAIGDEDPTEQNLPEKERERRRKHREHKAEAFKFDLEDKTGKKLGNFIFIRLLMLMFMIAALVANEGKEVGKQSTGELQGKAA